jgi:flagellar biosynthesis chaperone FliJ
MEFIQKKDIVNIFDAHRNKLTVLKQNRAKAEQNNCTDSEIEAYNQQITILASILSDLNKILHDKTISVESKNSWSAVEFSTNNWFDDLTDNYPNGVIIQKK